MSKLAISKEQRGRLRKVAARQGFPSAHALAEQLIERGLDQHASGSKESLQARLQRMADERGYSSPRELTEHLIERGLQAYEGSPEDAAALTARLRGLGYID